jgi:hypothetical protein
MLAGVRQVFELSRPAMLHSDDVLDVERVRIIFHANPAVLTSTSRAASDSFTNSFIHEMIRRALAWPWL